MPFGLDCTCDPVGGWRGDLEGNMRRWRQLMTAFLPKSPPPSPRCYYCDSELKCSLNGGGNQYYAACYYYSGQNHQGYNFNCPLNSGGGLSCPWGELQGSMGQCGYSYTYNILSSWRPSR